MKDRIPHSAAQAPRLSRREFCAGAAALVAAPAVAFSKAIQPDESHVVIAEVERARILKAAKQYLKEQPVTITSASSPRSAGGKHDYFSEADYFWPDPKNPDGPYINRDGMSNPDNFNTHRLALIRMSMQVPALTGAWMLTRDAAYARHAALHLRAWFVDDATRMNPNLQFAQAIHGRTTGRGIGIIDTVHLAEVARAISHLEHSKALSARDSDQVRSWFADYLKWMTTSKNGGEERETKNNHGTCWLVQAAEFARLTAQPEVMADCRERLRTVLMPHQIAADGSFPEELRRTKPYGYCLFNLDAMAMACQILSTPQDNLLRFELPDGRGLRKAMAYMAPFIRDKSKWPLPPDVQYFQDWPVRHPSLLFAGLALPEPEYIELWRKLDPDPTVPEIIRNFPYRQPLLWLTPAISS